MAKSKYKKKKAQLKDTTLTHHSKYFDLLTRLLSTSGLNKYEINKRIKMDVKAEGAIHLEIDLHRLTVEDTERLILKLLNSKALNISRVTLIHGFNHGNILKETIKYDLTHERISAKVSDSMNEGITVLTIKPWDQKEQIQRQVKNKQAKRDHKRLNETSIAGIEEEKSDAKFILEMMKESVKASGIKSKIFNEAFSPILSDKEKDYSEAIVDYELQLTFFLNHLQEFCVYEDTYYMRIGYKKKSVDEIDQLVKKLTDNKSDRKYVITIDLGKVSMKKLKQDHPLGFKGYFKCFLDDQGLLLSNIPNVD